MVLTIEGSKDFELNRERDIQTITFLALHGDSSFLDSQITESRFQVERDSEIFSVNNTMCVEYRSKYFLYHK